MSVTVTKMTVVEKKEKIELIAHLKTEIAQLAAILEQKYLQLYELEMSLGQAEIESMKLSYLQGLNSTMERVEARLDDLKKQKQYVDAEGQMKHMQIQDQLKQTDEMVARKEEELKRNLEATKENAKEKKEQLKEQIKNAKDELKDDLKDAKEEFKRKEEDLKRQLKELKHEAKERKEEIKEKAKEKGEEIKHTLKEAGEQAKDQAAHLKEQIKETEKFSEHKKEELSEALKETDKSVSEAAANIDMAIQREKEQAAETLDQQKEGLVKNLMNVPGKILDTIQSINPIAASVTKVQTTSVVQENAQTQ